MSYIGIPIISLIETQSATVCPAGFNKIMKVWILSLKEGKGAYNHTHKM